PKQRSNVRFTGILCQIILGGISMNKFVAHCDSIFEGDHFRKLDEKRKQRAARDIIESIVLDEELNETVKERILFLTEQTNQYLYNMMQDEAANPCLHCPLLKYCQNKYDDGSFQDL